MDASNRRGRYNDEIKTETLEHLRSLYENQRKSFLFALVNASDGLSAAAQIVDTSPAAGLLSKKEQKKLDKLNKSKKERKFRTNFTDRSKLTCYKCNGVSLKLFFKSVFYQFNFRLDILPRNVQLRPRKGEPSSLLILSDLSVEMKPRMKFNLVNFSIHFM